MVDAQTTYQPYQLATSRQAQWYWQTYVAFEMFMASTMRVQNACPMQYGKLIWTIVGPTPKCMTR